MNVSVISHAGEIVPEKVHNKIAVVIDVLRATSVMCTALENKAKVIIPVTTVDESNSLRDKILIEDSRAKVLRGGERNTYRIDGFELDNSPLSYNTETIRDAIIIMTTTNGTRTINSCHAASEIVIASLLNARAVSDYCLRQHKDVVLVCSGRKNLYTMEDGYCAGLIVRNLVEGGVKDISDLAWQEMDFYNRFSKNPEEALAHCEHYSFIHDRLYDDVKYCLREDLMDIIPKVYYNENSSYQEIRQ